jgi:hypothetical protein
MLVVETDANYNVGHHKQQTSSKKLWLSMGLIKSCQNILGVMSILHLSQKLIVLVKTEDHHHIMLVCELTLNN